MEVTKTKDKAIVKQESHVLSIPMMDMEDLKTLTAYVNDVKKTLMIEGQDYVREENRQYTARSGFAKLHQGFFLSDGKSDIKTIYYEEPQEFEFTHRIRGKEKTEKIATKIYGFEAYVTVINVDTGRHASGEGACTVEELHQTNNMSPKWYHRCLGTAKTRAWNRAVSNYVGSAEVSAEEMGLVYADEERKTVDSVQRDVKQKGASSAQSEVPVLITSVSGMEDYLEDNDIDSKLVEIVDEVEVLVMTPLEYLKTEWQPINELVKRAGGSWVKVEGKKNYWRIPKAPPLEEPTQEEQPQEPEEGEMKPFNPFASVMKEVNSIEAIEYILDGKFPGAQNLFAVTEDADDFAVEPMKGLEKEIIEETTALLKPIGGVYREDSSSIGYIWIIKKKE